MQDYNKSQKTFWMGISIYVIVVLVLFGFVAGLLVNEYRWKTEMGEVAKESGEVKNIDRKTPEYLSKDVDFNLYWQLWQTIKGKYINGEITDTQMFYGSLAGMVASLKDPHSVYLDPETSKKFAQELSGSFEGIGAEIGIKNNRLTIIAPLPDTPATRAGLQAGDAVLAIDNYDTSNIALDYAVSLIRGKAGTNVILTVSREGESESLQITITRGVIDIVSVRYEMKNSGGKNIAYIEINHFNNDTDEKFNKAVQWVLENNPDGVILDMRNNPGGFLETAVKVASEWVEEGVIVLEKFGDGRTKEHKSYWRSRLKGYPTVVLINQGSASGSEIVAGALQDYGLATLVGEKTFGKGSVQELEMFKDGSAVKLTVAKWLTPNGREIDLEGIAPDIEVELTKEDFNADSDPQLDKAMKILSE